jgi:hypothetical protein
MPSYKQSLRWEIQEVIARASLESNAANNLPVVSDGLVFQEEVAVEQRKVWGNGEESFI